MSIKKRQVRSRIRSRSLGVNMNGDFCLAEYVCSFRCINITWFVWLMSTGLIYRRCGFNVTVVIQHRVKCLSINYLPSYSCIQQSIENICLPWSIYLFFYTSFVICSYWVLCVGSYNLSYSYSFVLKRTLLLSFSIGKILLSLVRVWKGHP